MKNRNYLVFGIIILIIQTINAAGINSGNITFSLNQKEYYFKTGENAVINLNSENSYGETINGLLSYSITKSINQGNFRYSSSNTKSTSFPVNEGFNVVSLNFGTSDSPVTLSVDLKFLYTEDNKTKEVSLNGLKIHFVSDDSQKKNRQNKISSSSKEAQEVNQQENNPFSQEEQRIQQMMNQMMNNNNNNNQQQKQNPQQSLENNQMAQDSSALKKQMENQIQKQEQMKKEFQKKIAQDQLFQKEHQELLNKGYNLTNANFNPTSNDTGNFELDYRKKNGETASLKGRMKNGKIENLQKDTAEDRQKLLNKLQQNKQFQKYQKQLQRQGYSRQNTKVSRQQDKTNVKVDYMNENNRTASITAEVVNNTIQNVELQKTEKKEQNYLWILPVLLLLAMIGYFAYKKFIKKHKPDTNVVKKTAEKPFDYRSGSIRLLEKSKKLFEQKKYKDAYGTAGQALRLFLSYENNLNKEITNDEIIWYLRNHKKEYKEAKEYFDLCSLVEFAKYEANKKDFDRIIDYANKKVIKPIKKTIIENRR